MGRIELSFEQVLNQNCARVCRIAVALCGDPTVGMTVFKKVLTTSGVMIGRWTDESEAERWFLRYTVLCSRDYMPLGAEHDALFAAAGLPQWRALVVALRHLPGQQAEAFLLTYGERLELRQLATTMDCSSSAAKNHLKAATDSLQQISGGAFRDFAAALPGLLGQLAPPAATVEVETARLVRRRRRKQLLQRLVLIPALIATLGGVGWVIWKMLHN